MGFRGVLFDLDGTLHDRVATLQLFLSGHVTRFDLPPEYAERFTALDDFGYANKADVFARLATEYSLPHAPHQLFDDFRRFLPISVCVMPQAREVLLELRDRGLKLGVVTNGQTEMQSAVLEKLGLLPLLDDVLISGAVGITKPDPRLYALALSRLGLRAGETLFVGDSPSNYIQGPQLAGMRAAYLPTGHPLPAGTVPDMMLARLTDLLAL